ncbi:MAG: hypothetical protein ABSB22_05910 [Thermodesulfobacteriota bacterium]|jgi:hypothetical protein
MRFWDSPAIIPLCVKAKTSGAMKDLMKGNEDIAVCWTTRIECLPSLSRRQREGILSPGEEMKTRAVLSALGATL